MVFLSSPATLRWLFTHIGRAGGKGHKQLVLSVALEFNSVLKVVKREIPWEQQANIECINFSPGFPFRNQKTQKYSKVYVNIPPKKIALCKHCARFGWGLERVAGSGRELMPNFSSEYTSLANFFRTCMFPCAFVYVILQVDLALFPPRSCCTSGFDCCWVIVFCALVFRDPFFII